MAETPPIDVTEQPQFCPWCGVPVPYRADEHTPLYRALADQKGVEPPDAMEHSLHTDAYVCGCPGCRRVSHVIGHPPTD
ncbi:MAG: hypothetical protein ABR575_01000 [Actinomycetota bacterium]